MSLNLTSQLLSKTTILVGLSFFVPLYADAQISRQDINKLVLGSQVVSSSTIISAHRIEGLVLVELKGPGLSASPSLKDKAYVISRKILHQDPGYVRGVITRFYNEDGASFSDVIVTSKDVVGVDAGIENRQQALKRLPLTTIYFSQSGPIRFNSYLVVAEKLRENGDLYAAKNYYSFARQQDEQSASSNTLYLAGLFSLGRAFDLRGDISQVDLAYDQILSIVASSPRISNMGVLRQVAMYFKDRGDYTKAIKAANILVSLHKSESINSSGDYVQDMRILAFCNRKLGKVEEAKRGLEEALTLSKSIKVEDIPKVAILLEDLGDCYSQEGNTSQAFDFYNQAKHKYDSSMAARQRHMRVDYAIYRGAVKRLTNKIRGLGKTG